MADQMQPGRARLHQLRGPGVEGAHALRQRSGGRRLVHGESQRAHVRAQHGVLDAREILDQRPVRMAEAAESEESGNEEHQIRHALPMPPRRNAAVQSHEYPSRCRTGGAALRLLPEAVHDAPRSDSPDAGEAQQLAARGRGLDLRAEMGRLPRHRLPRRRRSAAAEPRPQTAQPILSGAGGPAPAPASAALRDRAVAQDWFSRFEGAGFDGVVAKRADHPYQPDKRTMLKIKHQRTADCVVAGFRWHKNGPGTTIGSLLLGLYDREGKLHHVGVTSSFTAAKRKALVNELAPLREGAAEGHPWREWAQWSGDQRMPGASSRWNRGKDLSWEPLRIERVCEVAYDHLQGERFRHGTTFLRWRPDKAPRECRYDQLEETPAAELKQIFAAR